MASVTEHLLANLSWKSWTQAKGLHKRILFTLSIMIIYRLGTYIPLPGIDPNVMRVLAEEYGGRGILAMFNMVSGGALERMGVFALNLMPYISASIIVQLMTVFYPHFAALKKDGDAGKRRLDQYTRYGAVGLAIFQSIVLASTLSAQKGVVYEPGVFFYMSTMATIVGATLFLVWLGEQISQRGIGNGSSMIIYAGIMANLPPTIIQSLVRAKVVGSSSQLLTVLLGLAALIAFVVFMEKAYRKVTVQYPRRQVGQQIYGGEQSYIPFKLNATGVLPPIFATALLGLFSTLGNWSLLKNIPILGSLLGGFSGSGWVTLGLQVMLIVFFAFFYVVIVFNPEETAENLRKGGAFIPGYRPGIMTVNYITYLLNRLTCIGAVYIAFVVVLPSLVGEIFGIQFPFQGTSLLIAVSVTLELISQVHSYIISHQYGSLMRRNQGGGSAKSTAKIGPTKGGKKWR